MDKLYTSSQARKKLNVSTSTFKRFVDSGKIRKVTPPGKKQGMYIREDVDKLAEDMQQFAQLYSASEPPEKFEFVRAKGEVDIKETVQIARQNLGDNAYDLEKRMSWFRKAPRGDYLLKHEGIIVGYFSVQAIKAETVNRIFHKNSGESIDLDDMEPIEPSQPLQVHVSGLGVKKGISREQAKHYGMILLISLFRELIELGKQEIDIRKIWAKSSTVPGIKLSRDLGFTEIGYINNEQIGFELNLETSELPFVKRYREVLKATSIEEQKIP